MSAKLLLMDPPEKKTLKLHRAQFILDFCQLGSQGLEECCNPHVLGAGYALTEGNIPPPRTFNFMFLVYFVVILLHGYIHTQTKTSLVLGLFEAIKRIFLYPGNKDPTLMVFLISFWRQEPENMNICVIFQSQQHQGNFNRKKTRTFLVSGYVITCCSTNVKMGRLVKTESSGGQNSKKLPQEKLLEYGSALK